MDKKELKKILAGLSIASLIAGTGLATGGCAATGVNAEKKSGAEGAGVEQSKTVKEAPAEKPAGGSG